MKEQILTMPIWGPLFFISTLAVSVSPFIPWDLFLMGSIGIGLCFWLQLRGFGYAFAALILLSIIRHSIFVSDHLWQLGLEGSLGLAFFISALSSEQSFFSTQTLKDQLDSSRSSLKNFEEEFAKTQQVQQDVQIALQEKCGALQKELEELQSEHGSILILNEVLRKKSAVLMKENDLLLSRKEEFERGQKELERLTDCDALVIQNKELMQELNEVRVAKEQADLTNETLNRMCAKEKVRTIEANKEAEELAIRLADTHREVIRVGDPLKKEIAELLREKKSWAFEFEKALTEANKIREELVQLQEVQNERNFLKERLEKTEEQLQHKEEKRTDKFEPLFKQLKRQFDEKQEVLQKTRAELFKVDTMMQKLQIEKSAWEMGALPKEVENELQDLGKRVGDLEKENKDLMEIVGVLSEGGKKKDKVQVVSEQGLLF